MGPEPLELEKGREKASQPWEEVPSAHKEEALTPPRVPWHRAGASSLQSCEKSHCLESRQAVVLVTAAAADRDPCCLQVGVTLRVLVDAIAAGPATWQLPLLPPPPHSWVTSPL